LININRDESRDVGRRRAPLDGSDVQGVDEAVGAPPRGLTEAVIIRERG
jgi:hypothetical protein